MKFKEYLAEKKFKFYLGKDYDDGKEYTEIESGKNEKDAFKNLQKRKKKANVTITGYDKAEEVK